MQDHAWMSPDSAAMLASAAAPFQTSTGLLGELRTALERAPVRADRPVRLAVVGQIKKGKSTLVNAILGRQLAVADVLEATYRVNEFQFGLPEGIEALYYGGDGTPRIRRHPLSDLGRLTLLDKDPNASESAPPDRIIISIDEPLLKAFELIDTPGLNSVRGVDSAQTADLLDGSDPEHSRLSQRELEAADAVLYMFDRDLGGADSEVVRRFLSHGDTGWAVKPIRALGVMSKCDKLGPQDRADWSLTYNPIELYAHDRIAAYFDAEPDVAKLFYEMVPVIGLAAVGAQTMPARCFELLRELAAQPVDRLLTQLRFENRFISDVSELADCPLPLAARAELLGRLGQWGILAACRYLRDGCDDAAVRAAILQDSGFTRLRATILSHFGARARLIKLDRLLAEIKQLLQECRKAVATEWDAGTAPAGLDQVADVLDRIQDGERGLLELEVRRKLGRSWVELSADELDALYRLTEPLANCAEKLGLPAHTSAEDLVARARAEVERWSTRSNLPGGDAERTRDAVRDALRIAEDIFNRVSRAAELTACARALIG